MRIALTDIPQVNGTYRLRGVQDIVVDGDGATVTQQRENAATVEIVDCERITWRSFRMVGLGTERPWSGTSANGASALRIIDSTDVRVETCDISRHTGGGVRFRGQCPGLQIVRNKITGMGPEFIHAGDNGSDAAIGHAGGSALTDGLLLSENDVSGHAFGMFIPHGRGMRVVHNWIHDIPGQHGIYGQPGGQCLVGCNVLWRLAYCGIKFQISGDMAEDIADQIAITGNLVDGCGQACVLAGDTTGAHYYRSVSVVSNKLARAAHGVYLLRVSGCVVEDNEITQMTHAPIYRATASGVFRNNHISAPHITPDPIVAPEETP